MPPPDERVEKRSTLREIECTDGRTAHASAPRGVRSSASTAACAPASHAARSAGSASSSANGISLRRARLAHLLHPGREHVGADRPGRLVDDAAHRRVGRLLEHHRAAASRAARRPARAVRSRCPAATAAASRCPARSAASRSVGIADPALARRPPRSPPARRLAARHRADRVTLGDRGRRELEPAAAAADDERPHGPQSTSRSVAISRIARRAVLFTVTQPPFQRLLDATRDDVWRYLWPRSGATRPTTAFRDLLAALRAWPRTRVEHPRAWVLTIAHRKALDHHRARARRPAPVGAAADVAEPAGPGPDADAAVFGSASATCRPTARRAAAALCGRPVAPRGRAALGARRRPPAARRMRAQAAARGARRITNRLSPPPRGRRRRRGGAFAATASRTSPMLRSTRRSAACWPPGRREGSSLCATRTTDAGATPCSTARRARVAADPRGARAPGRRAPRARGVLRGRAPGASTLPFDWALVGGFGRRVLAATAEIPSPRRVATRRSRSARETLAPRATGNALGANPIPIIVPCHRVLRTGGALGGYTGGTARKQARLLIEGVAV